MAATKPMTKGTSDKLNRFHLNWLSQIDYNLFKDVYEM